MKGRFFLRLRQAFKEQGIELPFPTVHVQGLQNPHGAENAPLEEITPELKMAVAQSHTNRRRKKASTTE